MALPVATVKAKRQKLSNAKLTSAQSGQIGWMKANAQSLVESEQDFGNELVEKALVIVLETRLDVSLAEHPDNVRQQQLLLQLRLRRLKQALHQSQKL